MHNKKNNIRKVNFNQYVNTDDFEISNNLLDSNQRLKTDTLIEKYKTVFAKDKYDIGTVTDYEAHIELMADK